MRDTATPPQGRAVEILHAAARVFRERGYNGGTLEEVGARLGITRAALYYYFRNKQAVLRELLTHAMRAGVTDIEAAIASSDDPEEQLTTAIASLIELIARERDLFTIYFQENEAVMTAAGEEARRLEEEYVRRFTSLVAEVLASRGVGDADPGVIARGLLGMCNWTYRWLQPDGKLTAREIATQWSAVFGLHQGPPRPRRGGRR